MQFLSAQALQTRRNTSLRLTSKSGIVLPSGRSELSVRAATICMVLCTDLRCIRLAVKGLRFDLCSSCAEADCGLPLAVVIAAPHVARGGLTAVARNPRATFMTRSISTLLSRSAATLATPAHYAWNTNEKHTPLLPVARRKCSDPVRVVYTSVLVTSKWLQVSVLSTTILYRAPGSQACNKLTSNGG